MWASIGWGATAPIAGAVVGAYGLKAAFLCFSALVGVMLLPTALLPMEALAKRGPQGAGPDAGGAEGCSNNGAGGTRGGPRLSTCSDKMGGKASSGSSVGDEAGGLLSVHVSAGSQPVLLPSPELRTSEAGGLPSKAQPVEKSGWSIGSRLDTGAPKHSSLAFEGLLAGALDAASAGSPPPSPQRPLLGPAAERSPSMRASSNSSSPLEIAAAQPVGGGMGGEQAGPAEVSVWQGIRGLLRDVHVLVFLLLALLMGIGNGAIG